MAKPSQSQRQGQIRIIGGQWRGRKLAISDSIGLRPTSSRMRETLFNWLAPMIQDARCLDCFSGSGALGLEALSRHAAEAVLLEYNDRVAKQLLLHLAVLKAKNAQVIRTNTLNWLARPCDRPFDLIFLDPPFHQGLLSYAIPLLEQQSWLSDEAWIYIESESSYNLEMIPSHWRLQKEKIMGQVVYRLFIREWFCHQRRF
ncbi:16S rRNA (guanine(966)-N(2))-methyltransferase RsmD [Candidatus Williamhamiltonella defendens]|uniref:16S rRNA (guanine(966)-N(2))-methyltransferase RsmD n=1 Tax=Candidatus Williamhamiltonella defendens TaxID=138072 RepID=UPI00130E829A|nr:16S rRNA (guanine(966)-N(2))-methyltransferase RsmD [Candidatus Hamiltonella defensa]